MEPRRFYGCYLLRSLNPRFKGHTYIGFTVNPRRRIRQHNGEITSGAWRTKSKRPWEMVLSVYGFQSKTEALQFEWAWQHPKLSKYVVLPVEEKPKALQGLAGKIKIVHAMLCSPKWSSMKLVIHFFSSEHTRHRKGCPALPDQMKFLVGSLDQLPESLADDQDEDESPDGEDEDRADDPGERDQQQVRLREQAQEFVRDRPAKAKKKRRRNSTLSMERSTDDTVLPPARKGKKTKKSGADNSPAADPQTPKSRRASVVILSPILLATPRRISPFAAKGKKKSSMISPIILLSPTPDRTRAMEVIDLTDTPARFKFV